MGNFREKEKLKQALLFGAGMVTGLLFPLLPVLLIAALLFAAAARSARRR